MGDEIVKTVNIERGCEWCGFEEPPDPPDPRDEDFSHERKPSWCTVLSRIIEGSDQHDYLEVAPEWCPFRNGGSVKYVGRDTDE